MRKYQFICESHGTIPDPNNSTRLIGVDQRFETFLANVYILKAKIFGALIRVSPYSSVKQLSSRWLKLYATYLFQ